MKRVKGVRLASKVQLEFRVQLVLKVSRAVREFREAMVILV